MTIISGAADCSSGLAQRLYNNLRYDNPWQANKAGVQVGTLACPTTANSTGFGYMCSAITTGVTGGAEPTWPLILTNTVVDGGVTWTCQDVANPSGKNHNSLNFGYVFTANDLDSFRLLAWNTAKAIIDEVNADKIDLATQASGASGGGWQVLYSLDFTTLTTQNLKTGGDGSKTLSNGAVCTAWGTGNASTFGITNGVGLTITNNVAANAALSFAITNLTSLRPGQDDIIVLVRTTVTVPNAATSGYAFVGFAKVSTIPSSNDYKALTGVRRNNGASTTRWTTLITQSGTALPANYDSSAPTNNLTDDIMSVRMVSPLNIISASGVWGGSFGAWDTLRYRGNILFTNSPLPETVFTTNDIGIVIGVESGVNSGVSHVVTNMQILGRK